MQHRTAHQSTWSRTEVRNPGLGELECAGICRDLIDPLKVVEYTVNSPLLGSWGRLLSENKYQETLQLFSTRVADLWSLTNDMELKNRTLKTVQTPYTVVG